LNSDTDPSYSTELNGLPAWDRSLWLSRAFLEASQHLCASMVSGEFSSQYSSSRVVLHLARHGIELFLKSAIELAGQHPEKLGHNLSSLCEQYWRLYPDQTFYFTIPPRYLVNPSKDLFSESDKLHATLDQRHRYAADKAGQSFAEPEIFDPYAVLAELEDLRKHLLILEWSKLRPGLTGQ